MEWRKASERLPDVGKSFNLKIDGRPAFGKFFKSSDGKTNLGFEAPNGFGTLFDYQFNQVEWLDETESAPDNKWISVEDRKPDKEGIYLAWVVKHPFLGPSQDIYTAYYGFGNDEDLVEMEWMVRMHIVEITHWQPLPSPPLSGVENEKS